MFGFLVFFLCWITSFANADKTIPKVIYVQQQYTQYVSELQKTYSDLKSEIQKTAPELLKKVIPTAPAKVKYGYQVLPEILADEPEQPHSATPYHPSHYSWPITLNFISTETVNLKDFKNRLKAIQSIETKKDKIEILSKLLADYPQLEENQRLIQNHIQHNEFWQKTILEHRKVFEEKNKLITVIEKLYQLRSSSLKGGEHKNLQVEINRSIQGEIKSPKFITIKKPDDEYFSLHVPVQTDIENQTFLKRFKAAVEKRWRVKEGTRYYDLRIDFITASAQKLYKGQAPAREFKFQDIDKQHIAHFAKNAAVLTTGGDSTYAITGRYIVLGPHPLQENILAHEFGHILGFVDAYVRGFRDLGKDGLEIIEWIPDSEDLMSAPKTGKVQAQHFRSILESLKK